MPQVDESTQTPPERTVEQEQPSGDHVSLSEAYDPAQQSLSDALRVSFLVLKVIMVIAVLAYLCSGIFQVSEHEKALRLRFGQIVGHEAYGPGWHFGFPYPIEQVIRVSTQPRTVDITNAYWYSGKQQSGQQQPLNPIKDGSLITGDANIVHARFQISYHVANPIAFERNIGSLAAADNLVKTAGEQAIVTAVAQTTADSVIRGNANQGKAQSLLQDALNKMDAGLNVDYVALSDKTMPQAVHKAFQAVINAQNEKAQEINKARQTRTQILGGAAGEAGLTQAGGKPGPLVALMDDYEFATQAGDTAKAAKLKAQLDHALDTLTVTTADGRKVSIGGEAASIINQAKSYGDQVQQQVLAERNNFLTLYQAYLKNPDILADRLWQNAREKIFTGNVETFYTTPGKPYIVINRSPAVQQELQKAALKTAEPSAKAAANAPAGGD